MQIKPKLVTFSGLDDSISFSQIKELHAFCQDNGLMDKVEIGILLNLDVEHTKAKYPSLDFIKKFLGSSDFKEFKKSIHLCGKRIFEYILEYQSLKSPKPQYKYWLELIEDFDRVQLNINARDNHFSSSQVQEIYGTFWSSGMPHILQCHPSVMNNIHCYLDSLSKVDPARLKNVSLLHDNSKGKGIAPESWPKSQEVIRQLIFHSDHHFGYVQHGFAGGLGPDNIEAQLTEIIKSHQYVDENTIRNDDFWIDMESNIRSPTIYSTRFDILKIKEVLTKIYLS